MIAAALAAKKVKSETERKKRLKDNDDGVILKPPPTIDEYYKVRISGSIDVDTAKHLAKNKFDQAKWDKVMWGGEAGGRRSMGLRSELQPESRRSIGLAKDTMGRTAAAWAFGVPLIANEQIKGTKLIWVKFGEKCRRIVEHAHFKMALNLVIVTAGLLVGLQTYPALDANPTIAILDVVILSIFTVEVALKIFADPLRPWRYFHGGQDTGWNCFDFLIVLSCMPFMPFGNAAAVLRLFRLLRILKLLKAIPQMRMIIAGLMAGMESAVFIFMLIFLIFYMFAVFGIMMFSKQDPWHFGNFFRSFMTLFRMSTFEDWSDVMYINYYGCSDQPSSDGMYKGYPAGGGAVYVTAATLAAENRTRLATETMCESNAAPVISFLYFHLFIVISALILLSMLVGAMAIAMIGVLEDLAKESHSKKGSDADAKKKELYSRLRAGSSSSNEGQAQVKLQMQERQRVYSISKCLALALGDDIEKSFTQRETEALKRSCCKLYVRFALMCRELASSASFSNFIALVIVFAGVMVGLQTDGIVPENATTELVIVLIFVFEVALKIAGEMTTPLRYFDDVWNRFDFFIVVMSFLPAGGAAVIMRLMRLMRVLKLLSVVPKLQMIVVTILNAFSSIVWIGGLLVLCYYMFAVAGCILFSENDPWHFGNVHLAMMSLFRASTGDDWTDIMYINQMGCDKFQGYPYDTYPELCVSPVKRGILAVIFFETFILLATSILLTLFIGIICAEMDAMADSQTEMLQCKKQVLDWQAEKLKEDGASGGVDDRQIAAYSKLFQIIQELKGGVGSTPSCDETEITGILKLLETHQEEEARGRGHTGRSYSFGGTLRKDEDEGDDGGDEVRKMNELFEEIDTEGSGSLNYFQFVQLMYALQKKDNCVTDSVIKQIEASDNANFIDVGVSETVERMQKQMKLITMVSSKAVGRHVRRGSHILGLRLQPVGETVSGTSGGVEMKAVEEMKDSKDMKDMKVDNPQGGLQEGAMGEEGAEREQVEEGAVDTAETQVPRGAWRCYTAMGEFLMRVTTDERFDHFMLGVVVFAGLIVGVQVGYGE
jgi:voltage-gated sodium channel